jgi:hypothetical protein
MEGLIYRFKKKGIEINLIKALMDESREWW